MADLSKAVSDLMSRLDAISGRIQAVEAQLASGAGASSSSSSSSSSGASSSGPSSGAASPVLAAFDEVVSEHLAAFEATSNAIATPRLKEQVAQFVAAVAALRNVIQVASQSKKPADLGSIPVVKAFFETANKVVAANKQPRKGDADFNHISALSEAVAGLSWFLWSKGDPQMNGVPAPMVQEGLNGATFYLNPIRVAHKPGAATENPDQIKWVNQLTEFFKQLQSYVLKNHTQGLVWNPNGGDAASASVGAPAAAAAPPAAGGPPPPPPPGPPPAVDPAAAAREAAASQARSNLFASLNKGDGVTTGLKKVTKDMQTHKNPELRASSVVPASTPKPSSSSSSSSRAASSAPARPPVTELQGNKWVVEWHKGNKGITIAEAEPKHVLYLYKLEDCVVQVTNPKINAITIDNCKKLGLVFHNVISGVEIVNSTSLEVQAQGVVPNFAIDKCSSVTVYISKEALGTQFVVSKSDSLNVIIPDGDTGETKELYVPEQFVSTIRDGALVTTTLEHE